MSLKVFLNPLSQPSRSVLNLIIENNIPHELVIVNLATGDHKKEDFLKINPSGAVPAINDSGFCLSESPAILIHLAKTRKLPDHWYPADPQAKASVNQYMHWHHSNLRKAGMALMYKFFNKDEEKFNQAIKDLHQSSEAIELRLKSTKNGFIANTTGPSIADLLAFHEYVSHVEFVRADLSKYPHLQKWYQRMKNRESCRKTVEIATNMFRNIFGDIFEDKKKVCVTGASGYIATHLVSQLLEKGYTVHGTVRDPTDEKKNSHLTSLKNASTHLKLFKAEFDIPNSFDEAFQGCYAVFHVASPYFYQAKDPQREIIDAAVDGTKSVLSSCEKAGVKVVIYTSSGTAMFMKIAQPGHVFSEEDWSDEDFMRKINAWYPLSKTLSERVFWEWAEHHKTVRCVAVAPSFVSGPPLQSTPNTSNSAIISLVDGSKKTVQNSPVPVADVRDVALAHLLVLENEKSTGRYLAGAIGTNFIGICDMLRKHFPERGDKIPSSVELKEGEVVRPPLKINNEKIRSLGINFRDVEESLKETIEEAIKKGFLN